MSGEMLVSPARGGQGWSSAIAARWPHWLHPTDRELLGSDEKAPPSPSMLYSEFRNGTGCHSSVTCPTIKTITVQPRSN